MPDRPLLELVERSADPPAVRVALERLFEFRDDAPGRLSEDEDLARTVVAVLAASRSLTRVLHTDRAAFDSLARLDVPHPCEAATPDALVEWKRRELLRIAARDLTGLDPLEATGASLAALAGGVLQGAWQLAGAAGLAVIGMGKLGAGELNYASDIDVLFVAGEGAQRAGVDAARRIMTLAGRCFRVDADLRPEGRDGPLARTMASYEAYWDRWADTWEFQALLKARAAAGDPALGAEFEAQAATRVWNRPFGADELREVRSMKARAEGELARRGLQDREVKRGRGGIRDVEFAVQLLQLVHGRQDPGLRVAGTLAALGELADAGYVDRDDAAALDEAYRFLRAVEHRLQLVDEQQIHALPTEPAGLERLARTMGYRDQPASSALTAFETDLRRHQATVRSIHERLFFRPLLEAFTASAAPAGGPAGGAMSEAAVATRLSAFGFADAARTRAALSELTRGLTRRSRLMQQMLPLLLEWLSESPDPDLGLLGLRNLVSGSHRVAQLVAAFRESPEAARRLCYLLGTTRLVHERFERDPVLIADLADDRALAHRGRAELLARAHVASDWRTDPAYRRAGLRHFAGAEQVRIQIRDILGLDDLARTEAALTELAEAVVEAAVAEVASGPPFAVIGMGRFGGGELSYASDLDVLFVFGDGFAPQEAEAAAEELLGTLNGMTPSDRIFLLDANLRPEGKDGALARSLDGYRNYYARWAATWERQALLRARPVAGDPALGAQFMEVVEDFVWGRPFTSGEAREVRRLKARMERERIPRGEDPQFHLKLGRGSLSDVEWTVQLLQLTHGVQGAGTMPVLDRLRAGGWIEPADADVLAEAYRYCQVARNRLYLVRGQPGDSLPTQADQLGRLARSLDTTPAALRGSYRRVTRRARAVMERLFYGSA